MIYDNTADTSPPEDHIKSYALSKDQEPIPASPNFGIDSPLGLLASNILAPLYLYATLKGKHQVWAEILDALPDDLFKQPTLDVGCGRGMVLLKVAQRKKKITESSTAPGVSVEQAYGIDIFNTGDQSGNSPLATYKNAAAMGVVDQTVLHTASFTERLPFADNTFSLVTSSLAIHNVDGVGRANAMKEIMRVCLPGATVVIIDLQGYVKAHEKLAREHGWEAVEVQQVGMRMQFGLLPCQVLRATKP
ncbi:uncharacterized protein E0L32_006661 [Thyridium curvatum]|uniref:Methyltransferase type 11 domain-containing protein n=1 Tax=Thyridium curvatum TaxID=1093900 RepID=A0A507B1T1_9PEZI|nr:uncharacterized protein E0L32_006661 [Thyridium curvatum]TPX13016.1 hypothetical protein E0L32_006661 [Thyridium curvatum]